MCRTSRRADRRQGDETGRTGRVVAAIQSKREREQRRLLDTIAPLVREVRLREPASELMLLSAAVLLDRARLEGFDAALARAAARDAARLHIDCVGPLPPFTFAELRI